MIWIHLVILVAVLQFLIFTILVGKARERFGVKAPAVTGNENFERYYRVQMNTLENLIVFIPSILLAATYWAPYLMALLGLLFIIGRILFFFAYINGKKRTIPFLMGMIPNVIFIVLGIFGTLRAIINV